MPIEMVPARPLGRALGAAGGFEVHADVPFQTLRHGGGVRLDVAEAIITEPAGEVILRWPRRPNNPFHGRLQRDGDSFSFWASDAGWFLVDPTGPTIRMELGAEPLRRELRMFGVPVALCALGQGDLSIHAASVEVDGQAVLLGGPSRFGKTTLAGAFARSGHRLLAEDMTICTLRGGARVHPGPAAIRLRRDVAGTLDVPGDRTSDGERVRVVIDRSARGGADAIPLRAVLLLRQGTDEPALLRASPATFIRDVFALTFRLPTPESQASCFAGVTDLLRGVDCFDLRRPLTLDSLDQVVSLVERYVRSE